MSKWTAHVGEDYAVVMAEDQTTDEASIRVDNGELAHRIAALLNGETARPDGPYRPELAEAFRQGARDLLPSTNDDRIHVAKDALIEESDGGCIVHCTMFVSDAERSAMPNEEVCA